MSRRSALTLRALLVMASVSAAAGSAEPDLRAAVIVKFRSEGEHALLECAEARFRAGRGFASATADGSPSLDQAHERLAVRRVEALFRLAAGDRPLSEQRERMQSRLRARALGGAGMGARRLTNDEPLPDLSHVYRVELGAGVPADRALTAYAADPHVAWVQRDHSHELDALPDDPFLWSSGAWDQPFEDLWALHRIRAPEAWALSRGAGVVVAVVDTGLDYEHPDIADNVWLNAGEDLNGNGRIDAADYNGVDDEGNGFVDDLRGFDFANSLDADQDGRYDGAHDVSDPDPFDDNGHGTHVAGTIAAVGDNGIGIIGVAPAAKIMALKGFPASGPGLDSVLWRAVVYALDNGAQVVNTSWSCQPFCPENPLAEEVVRLAHALGVVVVTSAGNARSDVVFNVPENMRETITVSSSGQDDRPSLSFTNQGWLVDVAAPGGDPRGGPGVYLGDRNILSLLSSADTVSLPFAVAGDYMRNRGTSMSAPHVSGVVALLRSARPELDYEGIRSTLRQSAVDLGPPGHDREMGAGRLDALAALRYGPPLDLHAAISSPRQGSVLRPQRGDVEILGSALGDDLQEYSLSAGLGWAPESWLPITPASRVPVRDGVLGRWQVGDLVDGSYVVRLEARARDGSLHSEFLLVSLERTDVARISPPGPAAAAPDVAGDLVVWHSVRDPAAADGESEDANLFLRDLATGAEHVISAAPGDQLFPSISLGRSGALIAWRGGGSAPAAVSACHLRRRAGACPDFPVTFESPVGAPVSARGRVFWVSDRGAGPDLRGCRPDRSGGRCDEYDLGLPAMWRALLGSDGRSLSWSEFGGTLLRSCEVDPRSGRCAPAGPEVSVVAFSQLAASGRLLAWVGFDVFGRFPLQICQFDAASGACPPLLVAEGVADAVPQLSGNRLVWDASEGDQLGDVFFCEFDAVRQRCPVQRLTAQMARQGESAIDGNRVVWMDERDGAAAIYGTELPELRPLRDRRLRIGHRLVVPVKARGPRGQPAPRLAAETALAPTLEALGARFVDRGHGRGVLAWRPSPEQVGEYAITFSAETEAGIVTRQSVRVAVLPARPPSPHSGKSRAHHSWKPQVLGRDGAAVVRDDSDQGT